MSTLKRAKAAMVLTTLLSVTYAAPAATLGAPAAALARQRAASLVALRSVADGDQTRIVIEGTAELPYTIYRPDERTILIDLPGVDAAKLDESYAVNSRGVERVQVERLRTASGQSLARLRVRLLGAVDERTVIEGNNLVLTLSGHGPAAEPTARPAATAAAEEPATMRSEPAAPKPVSATVDAKSAPAATSLATAISGVRTEASEGGVRAVIATDGRAPFKHFVLTDPDRIVVDVTGVRAAVDRPSFEVNEGGISRIRVGQFRTADPRIVRIVFDVAKMGPYTVRQVGNDIVLTLGASGAPSPVQSASAPATVAIATPRVQPPAPAANPPAKKRAAAPAPVSTPAAAESTTPAPVTVAPPPAIQRRPVVADDDPESVKPTRKAATPPPAPVVPKATMVTEPDSAPSVPAATAAAAPVRPVSENLPLATTTRSVRPALQSTPPAPMVPSQSQSQDGYLTEGFVGKPVSLDLQATGLDNVLRFFHKNFGVNFVVDTAVGNPPVTISLTRVPWNIALDAILKANGLGAEREGPIIRITTLGGIAAERGAALEAERQRFAGLPLTTRIFKLKYIPVGGNVPSAASGISGGGTIDITGIVRGRLSARGKVEIDGRSNRLIVTDLPTNVEVVGEMIRVLDKPESQVEIEARIVIANRAFSRNLGVQLAAASANPSRGGLAFFSTLGGLTFNPQTGGFTNSGGTTQVPGGQAGFGSVTLTTGLIGTFAIQAQINASETKGQARTIASPRVTALNNRTATVVNGVKIPIQTIGQNNTVSVVFIDAALSLIIIPQVIEEDGVVLLNVNISNNSPNTSFLAVNNNPGINTQSASTSVLVPDGGTTVIGGINVDTEGQSQTRVPGLGRIPILGELFKTRSINRSTDEILFFITPRIFRPELVGIPAGSSVRSGDVTLIQTVPAGSQATDPAAAPTTGGQVPQPGTATPNNIPGVPTGPNLVSPTTGAAIGNSP